MQVSWDRIWSVGVWLYLIGQLWPYSTSQAQAKWDSDALPELVAAQFGQVEVVRADVVVVWLQVANQGRVQPLPFVLQGTAAQRLRQWWLQADVKQQVKLQEQSPLGRLLSPATAQVGEIQLMYAVGVGLTAHVRLHRAQHAWQSPILVEDGLMLAAGHHVPMMLSAAAVRYALRQWSTQGHLDGGDIAL